jgi:hypothetical protein
LALRQSDSERKENIPRRRPRIPASGTRVREAHRYNHPIRIAERVATLDILSEGRVNLGSGKGASRVEREAFQIAADEIDSQWREALSMIPRMWRSDIFEWQGTHFKIPPTPIIPKPVQRPSSSYFYRLYERGNRLQWGSCRRI